MHGGIVTRVTTPVYRAAPHQRQKPGPPVWGPASVNSPCQITVYGPVAELRGIAAGRNELVAAAAGVAAGFWAANPAGQTGTELMAAALLICAGNWCHGSKWLG